MFSLETSKYVLENSGFHVVSVLIPDNKALDFRVIIGKLTFLLRWYLIQLALADEW